MGEGAGAPRVAVVGGGVLGVATAVELARGGARVTLVTEGRLADGASGRSLSWLNSSGVYSSAYHRLRMEGLARYRALAGRDAERTTSVTTYVHLDGGLRWAADDQVGGLREVHDHQRRVGYPSTWLTRDEVAAQVPELDPAAVPAAGALFSPAEGWVDLPSLVHELARELRARGGEIRSDAGRAELVVQHDRVTGVATASELLKVDAAVLATGSDVPRALRRVGIAVPDATAPALLVRTAPVAARPRVVLNTPRVSLRPAPGDSLVMDAGWSEREVRVRQDGTFEVDEHTVRGLVAEASAVLAGSPPLEPAHCGVGLKPVPGDGEPVLGSVPGVAGCFVAFTHSGATLALVVGELLAGQVLGGTASPLLEPFGVHRFAAADQRNATVDQT